MVKEMRQILVKKRQQKDIFCIQRNLQRGFRWLQCVYIALVESENSAKKVGFDQPYF